jgi:sigma-54 dependent transcriptional regulator, acetoin dehydrogenase operon transcriptional activator AcoR
MNNLPNSIDTESQRLHQIDAARQAVMVQGRSMSDILASSWQERRWLEESWRRCLEAGYQPEQQVTFDAVPKEALSRIEEANHHLLQTAEPHLQKLGMAIADTRYFAILTDVDGVVINTSGRIDKSDQRAHVITRIGVDLSERAVGTSAIGTALHEQKPVWLHRGEHFFTDNSIYSCAGAPLFAPNGRCMGMLDLTGIDAQERPELVHLVAQFTRAIENALVQVLPYALMVRVNWPGQGLGEASDGLVALAASGEVLGLNQAARQMLRVQRPALLVPPYLPHASDLFAMPFERFFDAARAGRPCLDVPLWSGLRVNAEPLQPRQGVQHYMQYAAHSSRLASIERLPLKDVASNLIKQAVQETRGNVAEAARKLGISRATLYRKLAPKGPRKSSVSV